VANKELYDKIVSSHYARDKNIVESHKNVFQDLLYKKMTYLKGETIVKEGTNDNYVYFIESGKIILKRKDAYGKEYCNGYLLAGEVFGLSSYVDLPMIATYKALTHCTVYVIEAQAIRNLSVENQFIKDHLDELSINMLRALTIRQGNLIMGGCRASFVNFIIDHLRNFGKIDERGNVLVDIDVSLFEISTVLNMTRETLSRIVGEMKREGIIDTKRKFIKIYDLGRFMV
jgi:CRP-like cAMP-binding protein